MPSECHNSKNVMHFFSREDTTVVMVHIQLNLFVLIFHIFVAVDSTVEYVYLFALRHFFFSAFIG